jgi:Flp pilus assembly protein TadD
MNVDRPRPTDADRARAYISAERWDEALALLASHLARQPDDVDALCLTAQCHIGRADPVAAEQAARAALALDPDREWVHRLLAIALGERRDFDAARAHADEAVRQLPWSWLPHRQRAEVDINERKVTAATWAAARRAIELAPDEALTHQTLGRVALLAKDNRTAIASFREALRLDPSSSTDRNNLAVAELRRRRIWSAGAHLVGALRLDPTSALTLNNLRAVLRVWALLLCVIGGIGAFAVIGASSAHVVHEPSVGIGPPSTITLPPGAVLSYPGAPGRSAMVTTPTARVLTLPGTINSATERRIEPKGRPSALPIAAGVTLLAATGIAALVRRSLGRAAGAIVLSSVRHHRPTAIALGGTAAGILALVVAAVFGMPVSLPAAWAALACFGGAMVLSQRRPGRHR